MHMKCVLVTALNIGVGGLSSRLTALEIPFLRFHMHMCILLSLTLLFYHPLLNPIQVIHLSKHF
ncbi:hypothetical protein BDV12DRAFT_162796 [Aspergillus spectabilis]